MKEITKYISDVCGIDIEFKSKLSCLQFEMEVTDLNTYISFGLKYDELVKQLENDFCYKPTFSFVEKHDKNIKSTVKDDFGNFSGENEDGEDIWYNVAIFMTDFAKKNEKVLRKYLDNKLQYVEATYSSSHDCHDEIESYAFPAEYTEEEILDYIGDCARSWYESMGYAEEAEDEDVEDEGPDYSFAVIPIEEIRKHNDWTSYSII